MILYNDRSMLKKQRFIFDDWPGSIYASATTAGTRPGPPIAGAWATLRHLGRAGLTAKTRLVRDTTHTMNAGLRTIGDLHTVHEPDMSVACFGSPTVDMNAVADVMDTGGWRLDRQPDGLHFMVSPEHDRTGRARRESGW